MRNNVNKLKTKNSKNKKLEILSNDNLPILLFTIIIINFLPIGMINAFTKLTPTSSSTVIEVACMLIEFFLLFLFFAFHFKEIKFNKIKIIYLIIVTILLFLAQIKNYLQSTFYIKDILNIGIFFVNVFFFYICFYDYKIKESKVLTFFKCIVIFAIIAIVWNSAMFFKDIIAQIGIMDAHYDYSYINNIKGFFGNRTALSFLILLAIVSSEILREHGKITDKYNFMLKAVFFIGIWSTHCKTAFLLMTLIYVVFICLKHKQYLKKIIYIIVFMLFSSICFLNVLGYFPPNIRNNIKEITDTTMSIIDKNIDDKSKVEKEKSNRNLNEIVVNKNRINNLSGRKQIWQTTCNYLIRHPEDIVLGVGKFSSVRFLNVNGKKYQHFHNLILELIMTGGIIELSFVIILFLNVIRKILNSDLNKNIKIIYYVCFGMYFINSMMETYGKFSIGYHDVLCLVFFVSIPLLHANSIKIEKK